MIPIFLKWNMTTKPATMDVWRGDKVHFSGEPKKAKKVAEELKKYEAARSK